MLWLGVDVGGTFTDLVLYDEETRRLSVLKTASTPGDHSEGMVNGARKANANIEGVEFVVNDATDLRRFASESL